MVFKGRHCVVDVETLGKILVHKRSNAFCSIPQCQAQSRGFSYEMYDLTKVVFKKLSDYIYR